MESSGHPLRLRDYFTLNVYWFALSFLWNAMGPLILPILVLRVVGETHKGTALGILSALGLLIATIVQPIAGAWTDTRTTRWGKRRPYIVGGTLFDVVFLIAILLAGDYLTLLGAYILLQVVSNIAHGPYQAYLTDLVPEAQRGKVTGVKLVFEMVGTVVTAFLIGQWLDQQNTAGAFLAIILVLVVAMGITARGIDERPFDGVIHADKPRTQASLWRIVFHSRDFVLWLVSRLLILVALNLTRNYLVYFLRDVLRIENAASEAGTLLAVLGIAVTLIVYPAGALSDRWGRKPLVIVSGILGAIGTLALLGASALTHVLMAGTIIGIGIGIFLSANWAWGADLIPADAGGRLLGVSNLATAGAGVLVGVSGGLLDSFNAQSPNLGYTILFQTAALCYVLGTLVVMGVRDERRR
jgi:Na+/melibiose symporter-like transporter